MGGFYLIGTLLLLGSFIVQADEGCFDKDKLEAKYKDSFVKCKAEFPEGTEKRTQRVGLCLLQMHNIVNENLELNFESYKEEGSAVILKHRDEIKAAVEKCYEEGKVIKSNKQRLIQFFVCAKVGMNPYCPEFDEWKQKNLQA